MRRIVVALAVGLVFVSAAVAVAQQVGSEGQIASFRAKLSPGALPRTELVPIKIRAEGEFLATPENHLAQLESLEVLLNRHGKFFTKGLPVCRYKQLVATNSQQALGVCGRAVVGHGLIRSTTNFPEQQRQHYLGKMLAFNGKRHGGGTVIYLHVHGDTPSPYTVVIPIKVMRTPGGTFGTTLSAVMPGFARRWAYLTKFRFVIGRRFKFHGKEESFLRASCPAPKGLNGAVFPFARAIYHFLTTKTLRTTIVGGCRVRE